MEVMIVRSTSQKRFKHVEELGQVQGDVQDRILYGKSVVPQLEAIIGSRSGGRAAVVTGTSAITYNAFSGSVKLDRSNSIQGYLFSLQGSSANRQQLGSSDHAGCYHYHYRYHCHCRCCRSPVDLSTFQWA